MRNVCLRAIAARISVIVLIFFGGSQLASAQVRDLQAALNAARPGDVIEFSGTHSGSFETKQDGTSSRPITIRGVGGNAVIDGFGSGRGLEVFHDHYRLENFTIKDFRKGLWVDNADHGIARNITVRNTMNEAFKFRNFSNFWLVESCSAINTGVEVFEFGEGFYVGDASSNWENSNRPDTSGYITFLNCYTSETANDGYDVKEGSHHVKFVNCVADFSQRDPFGRSSVGDSGFYARADFIQFIDSLVIGLGTSGSGGSGFKLFERTVNGKDFGGSYELAGISALEMGRNNAAIHFHRNSVAASSILSDDYSVQGQLYENGSQAPSNPAAAFVEMTWNGIGGDRYRGGFASRGSTETAEAVEIVEALEVIEDIDTAQADVVEAVEAVDFVNLRLEYDNQSPSSSSKRIRPNFKLYNDGDQPIDMANVTIRYYFTSDGNSDSYQERYFSVGKSNANGSFHGSGQNRYLEISFSNGAGSLRANRRTTCKVAIVPSNSGGSYDQSNDYSYGSNTSYIQWDRVDVFHNGIQVSGSAP